MEIRVKMKIMEKLRIIFKTINLLLERSLFMHRHIGMLSVEKIKEIVMEQKLFEKIDMERISKLNKKYIYNEEFENNEKFYTILYDMFLNKIYKFINDKHDLMSLFKTFNQAYFYKKYIIYTSEFIEKYPETLCDDIIKTKLFEIVHSLGADDKLYYQDFYFYISMYNIHYNYQKKDISIPEINKFNRTLFEISNAEFILNKIREGKISILDLLIESIEIKNSKNKLIDMILEAHKEIIKIINYFISNDEDLENVCWNEIAKSGEKNLINYLQENKSDKDVVELNKILEADVDLKEKFQFYFINNMKSFISLSEEDKYVIVNSFEQDLSFYELFLKYNSLKISYDEGMKKENNIKNVMKEIIEDEEFYKNIKAIFTSEKIADYCKNPIQYIKNNIVIYFEGEEEMKYKFLEYESNEFPKQLFEEELKNIEEEYKYSFQLDYEYFLNYVFDQNFLKERIIYSYLPYGFRTFVCGVPRIMINICGNNIISYKNDINSEDYKLIIKALFIIIILYEFINLIRRENRNESNIKEYTQKPDKNSNYDDGKSFLYHIFGDFAIIYLDIQLAKAILNIDSWKKDNKILKKELLRFNRSEKDIINILKKNGGIKCYDYIMEELANLSKERPYCC